MQFQLSHNVAQRMSEMIDKYGDGEPVFITVNLDQVILAFNLTTVSIDRTTADWEEV